MWTNSSGVASAAVVGAFLFSTHAAGSELPSEELQGSETYVVNFVGGHWITANTNVDGGSVPSERQDVAALGIGDVIQRQKFPSAFRTRILREFSV